jgi:hypothetical protein
MKDLINEIIPYCSETFITFPLWEEGNYCLQLNVWRIFDLDQIPEEDKKTNYILDAIVIFLDILIDKIEKEHTGFSIDFELAGRVLDQRIPVNFSITQSNIGDVLEPDFEYNYNIEEYMKVAIELLSRIKTNSIFKK